MRTALALASGLLAAAGVAAVAGGTVAQAATVPWAPWETASVHPGVLTSTGSQRCTSNFLFRDAAGHLYLGQAAHCARSDANARKLAPGEARSGCNFGSLPLGTTVGFVNSTVSGTLAYSSWLTMQEREETDKAACVANDFALVAIPDAARDQVNPSVPYFGGPTDVRRAATPSGEAVATFGNSPTRQGIDAIDVKQGYVIGFADDGWTYRVVTATPGIPGDSGSGLLDSAGKALGVIVTLSLEPPGTNGVTDAAHALDYARAHSGIRGLQLVPGTEAFVGPSVVAALAPPFLRSRLPAPTAPDAARHTAPHAAPHASPAAADAKARP